MLVFSHSVVSDSVTLWTVARQAPRPWDIPGRNTGVFCCFLLQRIFLTQRLNLHLLLSPLQYYHFCYSSYFGVCSTGSFSSKSDRKRERDGEGRRERRKREEEFSSVQSLSRVRLFETAWIAARQASLSITNSQSLLILTSIESGMPSSTPDKDHTKKENYSQYHWWT